MKFLKKLSAPKEVKAAIAVLDEFGYSCDSTIFQLVREVVESTLLEHSDRFISVIREDGITPRQKVYSMMENVAGDYLESGSTDFYVYRGLLNPCGEELLKIYDLIIDRMSEIGRINEEQARKQKSDIRNCIKRAC